MSRGTIALDRTAAFIAGLVLLVLGAAGIAWPLHLFAWMTPVVDVPSVTRATQQPWWPWVTAALGLLLILLGLRWVVAHLPDSGVSELKLSGSSTQGKLRAAANPVAQAAAQAFTTTPGVRSTRGKILRERGELVAYLDARIEAGADLRVVAAAADQVAADLAAVVGRDDLRCQVQLKIAHRSHPLPRVS